MVNITNLNISGSLNSVDLEERLGDAVRQHGTSVSITGTKTFRAPTSASSTTTFKNIKVSYLNDVALDYYLSHVVVKNSPAHLLNAITVIGTVTAPRVTATSLIVEASQPQEICCLCIGYILYNACFFFIKDIKLSICYLSPTGYN